MIFSLLLVILSIQPAFAQAPQWMRDLPEKQGSALLITCHGEGPDRDLAYRAALDECRSLATDQLQASFQVKTLSVQTERDAGFHEEVSAKNLIQGLMCNIKKQAEENATDHSEVWLKCQFDTSVVKVVPVPASKEVEQPSRSMASSNRLMSVGVIPPCESILVVGKGGRVQRCNSNPQPLLVYPTDQEIIIRSTGFAPRHIKLGDESDLTVYMQK